MSTADDIFCPVSQHIWETKYRLKDESGGAVDKTVEDTFSRVARAVAKAEKKKDRKVWQARFYDAMSDFAFLPAGRILAGAGSGRKVTLFNCFVMGEIADDMSAIFENVRDAALTMQQGGGIGHDFSTLRPKGAVVAGVGAEASGPVSFMDVWDAMCRTIMSAGMRRGAMMATLACDHPDIEEFIEAKRDPNRLRMFNMSVLVSDAFMAAVQADDTWELTFGGQICKSLPARRLWEKILRATFDYAEPGVIFIDRVNRLNPLNYCETIHATNPCGEQPLPPFGACLLGSINLARLVEHAFEDAAALDETRLKALVQVAVRFLDNVIDVSHYPLKAQKREALTKRRIGLGVTGLANALIMCGLRYGSSEAAKLAKHWMGLIQQEAYLASSELAREKGAFPLFEREAYLGSPVLAGQPEQVRDAIARHGIRNGLLTSIAPTGTISLFAGNVSSGVEPVFDFSYRRRILGSNETSREHVVEDYAYRRFRAVKGPDAPLPDWFVSSADLAPSEHLAMQAALQAHVDSAISKTVNCPADMSFAEFQSVYDEAFALGLKGCTTYRPNEITGAVLSRGEAPAAQIAPNAAALERTPTTEPPGGDVVYMSQPLERDEALAGATYKLKWPDSDHAIYVTINDITVAGRQRPFEIFINSKNLEHYAWTVALTRMISAVFRRGGDVSFVVEELKAVFDPRGGQWMDGRYVPSLLAAIGGIIERHMIDIGFIEHPVGIGAQDGGDETAQRALYCPKCSQPALIFQEGCHTCRSCGYSKCS